jgi:thioredoxin reductase (NADPH)
LVKPIIMTVDDEPQVLNAIERDLRAHYHRDYRVVKAGSGQEALETLQKVKQRNAPVALLLVDQRMPGMSGTEFMQQAIKLHPEVRKVLLTAYADTDAAITSINEIGLDYYLMKPWDPPEENLYPVLDDLLSDWLASVPVPYDGIRVAGTQWSVTSHNIKDFLARNRIPYRWSDIEKESDIRELVEKTCQEHYQLPVLFFPDGSHLIAPTSRTLAEKIGLYTHAKKPFYDLIIVGAGPAGLAAAVYGASEGLRTIMIEREAPGGQAGTSARIENYLGFPQGLSGVDLAHRATIQAKRFGAEILTAQEVINVRVEDPYRIVTLDDNTELSCHALLIATGMTVRKPDVPDIDFFIGVSVYYGAAISEARHFQDGNVFVIGGANSAGQGAVFFAKYAKQVTMLVRGSSLNVKMSQYLVDQIKATPNIKVQTQAEMAELHGTNRLEAITVRNRASGETEKFPADAVFIFIGGVPHSGIVADIVELSNEGFIITGPDLVHNGRKPRNWSLKRDPFLMETSVPGIFAAGDVRHNSIRRVASAVGQGSVTISFVHKYLETV